MILFISQKVWFSGNLVVSRELRSFKQKGIRKIQQGKFKHF